MRTVAWFGAALTAALLVSGCGGNSGSGSGAQGSPSAGSPSAAGSPSTTPSGADSTGASASPSTDDSGGASATPSRAAGPDRCHTSQVSARFRQLDSGAGQRYAALILTNTGRTPCTVFGYGGLQLVNAARKPLPTALVREKSPAPHRVLLRSGAAASSLLHWSAVPGPGEAMTSQCEPTPASARVTPPDERDNVLAGWHFGPVCEHGRISQQAYVAGTGAR
jgi:hypothetical protein